VPSVVVGTDTRLFVFEPLGLPLYFVKDVTQNLLAEKIAWMLQHREQERTRLLTLKTATLQRYIALVQESLSTRLSKS
jgi:hypothetical protein